MPRRQRSRRRGTRAGTSRIRRLIGKMERGSPSTPAADPPHITRAPWWPFVIQKHMQADVSIVPLDILDNLLVQLGHVKPTNGWTDLQLGLYIFKVQAVQLWGLDKQSIGLNISESISDNNSKTSANLVQLSDMGSGFSFSRLGFNFGVTSKIEVLTFKDTRDLFDVHTSPKGGRLYLRIHILWCVAIQGWQDAGSTYLTLTELDKLETCRNTGDVHSLSDLEIDTMSVCSGHRPPTRGVLSRR